MGKLGEGDKLFGTDGVRGIANEELTVEMALNLGKVMGTLRKRVAVGKDSRLSGSMLKSAVIAGITSAGADVVDLGLAPTPALQYYVKKKPEVGGGIVVTASHNPKNYNGIKFIQEDGREFTRDMDDESEKMYRQQIFDRADWSKVGQVFNDEYLRLYLDGMRKVVKEQAIKERNYTVVIDCGNGAGGAVTPQLLRELGCNVISINSHFDGRFPQRNPEPTEENVGLLREVVNLNSADLGVAHDGDADRATFVNEKGEFVGEDIILALMAKHYIEKSGGGKFVTPVSSSRCAEDVVKDAGGEVVYTKVGSPVVSETMLKVNAAFGGEGNGGLIFPEHLHARDGAMSAAKILELMAVENKPLSQLVNVVPRYYTLKTKVKCSDKNLLLKGLQEEYPNANLTDGARIDFEDGWLLIRPSGTEPIARIFSEAQSEKRAQELLDEGLSSVKKILES
ncbi:MAG: phosphoglucosamine mutase [Candidatus Hadarchaeota archaeon]